MAQAIEEVFVQQFVPHPAIERFNEPILHRLARRDAMPLDQKIDPSKCLQVIQAPGLVQDDR